jgi:hypothetical protein
MEIAIMTGIPAKRDMDINSCHAKMGQKRFRQP